MLWHSLAPFSSSIPHTTSASFSNSQKCRHVYFSNVDERGLVSRKYFRLASLVKSKAKIQTTWRTRRNRWRLKKETLRAFKIWLDLYHSIFNMHNHSVTLYWLLWVATFTYNGVLVDCNSASKLGRYLCLCKVTASTVFFRFKWQDTVVVLLFCLPFFFLTGSNVATANGT